MKSIVLSLLVQEILINNVMTKSATIQFFDSISKTGAVGEALPSNTIDPMPEAESVVAAQQEKYTLNAVRLPSPPAKSTKAGMTSRLSPEYTIHRR